MEKKKKKTWTKPILEKVRLVPEEAVLWGCKGIGGAATAQEGLWGSCWTGASCPSPAS